MKKRPSYTINKDASALTFTIAPRKKFLDLLCQIIILTGQLTLQIFLYYSIVAICVDPSLAQIFINFDNPLEKTFQIIFCVLFCTLFTGSFIWILFAVLWKILGKETVKIGKQTLEIQHKLLIYGKRETYNTDEIYKVYVLSGKLPWKIQIKDSTFWRILICAHDGVINFTSLSRQSRFGSDLTADEGFAILREIKVFPEWEKKYLTVTEAEL